MQIIWNLIAKLLHLFFVHVFESEWKIFMNGIVRKNFDIVLNQKFSTKYLYFARNFVHLELIQRFYNHIEYTSTNIITYKHSLFLIEVCLGQYNLRSGQQKYS